MSEFVIFTDSSSELSLSRCQNLGIHRVDLGCTFADGTSWRDLDNADGFYQKLSTKNMAKTAAASKEDFIRAFKPILESGRDILMLPITSSLSATYGYACQAAEQLSKSFKGSRNILVPNTNCVCGGLEYLVTEAIRLQQTGANIFTTYAYAEKIAPSIAHHFTTDDLSFFRASGRVSFLKHMAASMVNAKPVMHMNDEGKLVNRTTAHSTKSALKNLADEIATTIKDKNGRIIISHANCPDKAHYLCELITKNLPEAQIELSRIGPTIGAHAGPGTVAVFFGATHR